MAWGLKNKDTNGFFISPGSIREFESQLYIDAKEMRRVVCDIRVKGQTPWM
jgi:hypothetical protein